MFSNAWIVIWNAVTGLLGRARPSVFQMWQVAAAAAAGGAQGAAGCRPELPATEHTEVVKTTNQQWPSGLHSHQFSLSSLLNCYTRFDNLFSPAIQIRGNFSKEISSIFGPIPHFTYTTISFSIEFLQIIVFPW